MRARAVSSYTTRYRITMTDSRVKQSHWRCPYCICWYINTGDIAILDGIPGEVEILPELQYMETGGTQASSRNFVGIYKG